jgi:metal-sulfur cluster biosynthetic enzyme
MSSRDAAWSALGQVRDPELDQPITELGFVAGVQVKGDSAVRAELRLPTYFCAPNFAWLMVADAHDALAAEFERVEVVLLEHFVSDEINAGVAAVSDFAETFAGDATAADPELTELRTVFERKAHTAAQERMARALVATGVPTASLAALSWADAAEKAPEAAAAVARRRTRLGLTSTSAFCDDEGASLRPETMPAWLRFAQTVRVSIEGNAGFCRGLLETRYGLARTG